MLRWRAVLQLLARSYRLRLKLRMPYCSLCVVRVQGVGTGLSRSQRAIAECVSNQAEPKKGPNAMSFLGGVRNAARELGARDRRPFCIEAAFTFLKKLSGVCVCRRGRTVCVSRCLADGDSRLLVGVSLDEFRAHKPLTSVCSVSRHTRVSLAVRAPRALSGLSARVCV